MYPCLVEYALARLRNGSTPFLLCWSRDIGAEHDRIVNSNNMVISHGDLSPIWLDTSQPFNYLIHDSRPNPYDPWHTLHRRIPLITLSYLAFIHSSFGTFIDVSGTTTSPSSSPYQIITNSWQPHLKLKAQFPTMPKDTFRERWC